MVSIAALERTPTIAHADLAEHDAELEEIWKTEPGLMGVLGTVDHKKIGLRYLFTAFGFLIILAQLVRYNWDMDDAAMVFGAKPLRCFWEITLPTIWPSLFGAFLISFILAFNNLEISFYNLGAIPTLPSVAWGSLRFGLGPELFALAALVNGFVFLVFAVMYLLMRFGIVRFGYRGV